MSEKNYQQAEEALRQQKLQEVQKSLNFAYDSLVSTRAKSKLPENIFVFYFVPFFAGEPVQEGRNVVAEWIGVAGTPMSEVDIIDPAGNVLFTVPAIFNSNILEVANQQAGKTFADIYYEYELRKAGVPVSASGFLAQTLNQKVSNMVKGEHDIKSTTARWESIMARYGRSTPASSVQRQGAKLSESEDLTYD